MTFCQSHCIGLYNSMNFCQSYCTGLYKSYHEFVLTCGGTELVGGVVLAAAGRATPGGQPAQVVVKPGGGGLGNL